MRIDEIRRLNLIEHCARECGGNQAELARRAKRKPNQIADMLAGRKAFGEKVARDIEANLGMARGELDVSVRDARTKEIASPALPGSMPVGGMEGITSSMLRSPEGRRLTERLQQLEQAGRLTPQVLHALAGVLDLAEPIAPKYQRIKDKAHAAQDPAE